MFALSTSLSFSALSIYLFVLSIESVTMQQSIYYSDGGSSFYGRRANGRRSVSRVSTCFSVKKILQSFRFENLIVLDYSYHLDIYYYFRYR